MTSDSSVTTDLIQDLEKLSQDPRLARVFRDSGACSLPCSLHLWLLELTQDTKTEYRLLFGWVIPATYKNPGQWYISDGGRKQNWGTENNPYKFRIAKLTLYDDSHTIFSLIKELAQGFSLDNSCKKVGIDPPHQKNPYGQLCLAKSPRQLAQSFAVRPVVFLETGQTNRGNIKSPIDDVPAFAGFLWQLYKLSLFYQDEKDVLPEADDLIRKCLYYLTEETGLNFCGADSERLGNIEWLSFPAADEYENSQVKIDPTSSPSNVKITVLAGTSCPNTQIIVRCRLWNSDEVILDKCKISQITNDDTIINFIFDQEINKFLVTIWKYEVTEETWSIWYEYSYGLIKQIGFNLGIPTFQAKLQSYWLEKFKDSKKSTIRQLVEDVQSVQRVHYDKRLFEGYKLSPWIAANKIINKLTQKLFHKSSSGRFFPKGWATEEGGLSFLAWLKSLTKSSTASKLLLVDPYFDTSGVIELIARAEATQTEYVVLTNTQVKSNDDSLELEDNQIHEVNTTEEPQRAKRLKTACKNLGFMLTQLKFKLLDVRSRGGGKTQQFHDRYILVFDELGEIEIGYHLSNSIQKATRYYPLLITPINGDVLTAIEKYVIDLLAPANDSSNEIITLFDSNRNTDTSSHSNSKHQQGIAAIPYAGFFFAALLNENRLSDLEESELSNNLQDKGILIREGSGFTVTKQVYSQLNYFVQILVASGEENFAKLWTALGAWLAHSNQSGKYFEQLVYEGDQNLCFKIQHFLSQASYQEPPIGSLGANHSQESLSITHLIKHNFIEVISDIGQFSKGINNDYSFYRFYDCFGIKYAAKALAILDPELLLNVITELRDALKKVNENNSNYWAIAHTLTSVIKQILNQLIQIQYTGVTDNGLLSALLRSDVPLLRAIAAQSLSPLRNQNIDLHKAFNTIDILLEKERLYALAEWVFELRIRANQNNRHENEEIKNIRLKIFDKIRQVWVENLSAEELRDVVHRLGGPSEGSWAVSTSNELLLPLQEDNKLTVDEIAQLWLTILVERLEACISAIIHKPDNQSSRSWFNELTDRELTFTCGWAIANATEDCRTKWRDKLNKKIFNPAKRTINRPFSRSLDFSAWKGACDSLLWLKVLVEITLLYGVDGTIGKENELEELVSRLEKILDNIDITLWTGTKDIRELLSEVKQDREKHLYLPE
ncbi:VPA1262 family protein [Coleofasciculus sp. E2-BRE-01]|uniref:VPA1262 family protein n=1 Tax=Coleofasciculus sp. E2-BRE-01 TaxID=3069524 RepID=UPI0032FE8374